MSGINGFGFGFASPDSWESESLLATGGNSGFTCNATVRCSQVKLFHGLDTVTGPLANNVHRMMQNQVSRHDILNQSDK